MTDLHVVVRGNARTEAIRALMYDAEGRQYRTLQEAVALLSLIEHRFGGFDDA